MARIESSLDVFFGTLKGAVTKTLVGWVKYIGDGKLCSYMGIITNKPDKDPYEPTRVMECHKAFERCSNEGQYCLMPCQPVKMCWDLFWFILIPWCFDMFICPSWSSQTELPRYHIYHVGITCHYKQGTWRIIPVRITPISNPMIPPRYKEVVARTILRMQKLGFRVSFRDLEARKM